MMLLFGRQFFMLLGGRGGVLEQACNYSQVLFSGAVSIWLVNTLASVLRGTGDMRLPSATLIGVAIVQIAVGGALGLGLAGLPNSECTASPPASSLRSRSGRSSCCGTSSAAAAG